MRTATEILAYVLSAITEVYERPMMYAETASAVETVLNLYHDAWAVIMEQEDEYRDARSRIQSGELANADLFSNNFAKVNPGATEAEKVGYAIQRWRQIDQILGI